MAPWPSLSTGIVPISLFGPLSATIPRILILLQPYGVPGPLCCLHFLRGPLLPWALAEFCLGLCWSHPRGLPTPGLCHLNLSQHHPPEDYRTCQCAMFWVSWWADSGQRPCCLPSPFVVKGLARFCQRGSLSLLPAHSSRVSRHPRAHCLQSSPQHRASESIL